MGAKAALSYSVNLGIARLTFSRSGISVSSGIPGARVGMNSKGQGRLSLGIPGIPGLRYTKTKKIIKKK